MIIFYTLILSIFLYGAGITAKIMGSTVSWFWVLFGPILLLFGSLIVFAGPFVVLMACLAYIHA